MYVNNPRLYLLKKKIKITVKTYVNAFMLYFCVGPQKYKVILPFRILAKEQRSEFTQMFCDGSLITIFTKSSNIVTFNFK